MDYRILPPDGLLEASVRLPLSKSMSNRALIISALAPQIVSTSPLAQCDDINVLRDAIAANDGLIDLHRSGTALRFLTAFFAAKPGSDVVLTGDQRLLQRPVAPLVDALISLGADIEYVAEPGFPPLKIRGKELRANKAEIDASLSSQFVSALLLIAPTLPNGLQLTLTADVEPSKPYIDLTIDMMTKAGADVRRDGYIITVAPTGYSPSHLEIEADWSAASFWYEIEALTSGWIALDRLNPNSPQPDRRAAEIFQSLGVLTDFDGEDALTELSASPDLSPRLVADLAETPDLTPPLVVACVMLRIPFRLSGLQNLALKESDRLAALVAEMLKLGARLDDSLPGVLEWDGVSLPISQLPEFETYGDHRLAMALAPVGLYIPGVLIKDADVVAKSYPAFWDDIINAGFRLIDGSIPLEELQRMAEEGTPEE